MVGGDTIDFEALAEMITKYRILLDREKNNAFLQQFDQFLLDAANISDETTRADMTHRLNEVLETLTTANLEPHEILIEFFESEIIQDMIKTRNSARERELRHLTYEFGSFIKDAAYNTDTDEEFLRNLLKQSLQQLSNSLEPRTIRKKGESMIDVWVRAMEEAVYKN
tara:strand:- start:16833 stop:17336 length:504 start_codon:yes stop_codon:yes gene_type:complete